MMTMVEDHSTGYQTELKKDNRMSQRNEGNFSSGTILFPLSRRTLKSEHWLDKYDKLWRLIVISRIRFRDSRQKTEREKTGYEFDDVVGSGDKHFNM